MPSKPSTAVIFKPARPSEKPVFPEVKLDGTGEPIISFMASGEAETLLNQIQDTDAELNALRKQCWRNGQRWKAFYDVRHKGTSDYWKYKRAWSPYYTLRDTRDKMLSRLKELESLCTT